MGNYWATQPKPKYGWKRPANPHKNRLKLLQVKEDLPSTFDLTAKMPVPYDQGSLGSCTANATAAAFQVIINNSGIVDKSSRSRLFIYFNSRMIDGDPHTDSGTTIEASVQSIEKQGVCSESLWPYVISYFSTLPNQKCYSGGKSYSNISAHQLDQSQYQIEQALYQGYPVLFGILVYASFESKEVAKTGIIPMPKEGEQELGGHALVLISYNRDTRMFGFQNSWSPQWGQNGRGAIPYDYILSEKLASEFWVITNINS